MGLIEGVLVKLFIGVLGWLAQRHDLRKQVLAEADAAGLETLLAAESWRAGAYRDPGAASKLRVPEDAPRIIEFTPNPDPPKHKVDAGNVPPK